MKNLRKLFAVTLLVLTFALPAYAEGQIDTPKPAATQSQLTEAAGGDAALTQTGQIDTPKSAVICLIESILALI